MANKVGYNQRFLNLSIDSPVEESKLAYDEMAPVWDQVSITTDLTIFLLGGNHTVDLNPEKLFLFVQPRPR